LFVSRAFALLGFDALKDRFGISFDAMTRLHAEKVRLSRLLANGKPEIWVGFAGGQPSGFTL
jgi:hypothetical protein